MPRSAASATAARRRCVFPTPVAPQIRKPGAPSRPSTKRSSATRSSPFLPGRKFARRWGSGGASSKISCSKSAVEIGVDVLGAQMPQADQQRGARGQRNEHAGKAEHLAESEQREDDRQRVQADAISDEQ